MLCTQVKIYICLLEYRKPKVVGSIPTAVKQTVGWHEVGLRLINNPKMRGHLENVEIF